MFEPIAYYTIKNKKRTFLFILKEALFNISHYLISQTIVFIARQGYTGFLLIPINGNINLGNKNIDPEQCN